MVALAGACGLTLAAGCDSDDFENEPRPPAPIEVTAKVDNERVKISPGDLTDYECPDGGKGCGAGLANITIANISDDTVSLTFEGPTSDTTRPIPPDGVLDFKIALEEGTYEVTAGAESSAKPDEITVGPERASAQNELLLP